MTRRSDSLARCIAVLGTASDVGKSVIATALCRVLSDEGIRVTPFKAQNMSNNSYITPDGGEIGRAQVAQAEAARLEPHVDMNPVLLKPCTDIGSQIVLHGKPIGMSSARDYGAAARELKGHAERSLFRLRREYDAVVMEGAGSCAEINLKERDFVNLHMAHAADAAAILVADIDRGGVFAQIVGTLEILPPEDRDRIKGFIVNRFRGDPSLFDSGVEYIEQRTGRPVLGIVPFVHDIGIDVEDAASLEPKLNSASKYDERKINIAVIKLPHLSNFTDFSPLEMEQAVNLDYVTLPRGLKEYDLVLLPGTKNVRGDLDWLVKTGWRQHLYEYVECGGELGGICGGYQMMGKQISDPTGIEGPHGTSIGLDMLDVTTTLRPEKTTTRLKGIWIDSGDELNGYEIHQGVTERHEGSSAAVQVFRRNASSADDLDGARSATDRVWGTYFHGLFDELVFRRNFLKRLRPDIENVIDETPAKSAAEARNRGYDRLADLFRSCVDMRSLYEITGMADTLKTPRSNNNPHAKS